MRKHIIVIFILSLFQLPSFAQHVSIGTNLLGWADLGTINADINIAISNHLSAGVGGAYNGWEFPDENEHIIVQDRKKCAYVDLKYWLSHVYSGFWFAVKGQYLDYCQSGIWRIALDNGKCLGCGGAVGYSYSICKHFNIGASAGVWGGRMIEHSLYDCPKCMMLRESGARPFIAPDSISLSIAYIF